MTQAKNPTNRQYEEIIYWRMQALSNLHSLSESILVQPYPQLYSKQCYSWARLFFNLSCTHPD